MAHYVVNGEFLNEIFGEEAIGTTKYLPDQNISFMTMPGIDNYITNGVYRMSGYA